MSLSKQQKFWNRIGGRYLARPLKDVVADDACEFMLERDLRAG